MINKHTGLDEAEYGETIAIRECFICYAIKMSDNLNSVNGMRFLAPSAGTEALLHFLCEKEPLAGKRAVVIALRLLGLVSGVVGCGAA
jgi:hypothetical protein